MSEYTWPAAWALEQVSMPLEPNVRGFESAYTKSYQGVDLLGERFVMRGRLPHFAYLQTGALEAFFNRLRLTHLVRAWYFRRPVPVGTQRGTPSLSANVAQMADVLPLTGVTPGNTLLAGDMLGVGDQLFQVADPVTFASTTGNVTVANRARKAISNGTAVVWDKPTHLWRLANLVEVQHAAAWSLPLDFELIQHWED